MSLIIICKYSFYFINHVSSKKNGCFFLKEKQPFFIYLKVRLYLWSEFITDSGQCRKVMSTNTTSYFSKTCASFNTYNYVAKFKSNS